jgi:hypothetical protein
MNSQSSVPRKRWWHQFERGQAMMEYWPTLPAAVMVAIMASAIVGPIQQFLNLTTDGLSGVACDTPTTQPNFVDLEGGHRIEVTSSNYDGENTTVTFKVSSGDSPSISHWVLGLDKDIVIVDSSERYEDWGYDPTTYKYGFKFEEGYDGTGGSSEETATGPKKARLSSPTYRPAFNTYVEEREIVLTLSGYVDFVEYIEVTTKAGDDQVSTGYVSVPPPTGSSTTTDSSCVS